MESVYDIVKSVAMEASKQFGNRWVIADPVWHRLKADCSIIDQMITEFDCETVQVDIDDETMELTVCIICPEMVFENGITHSFFRVVQNAKGVRFSTTGEFLKADIVFQPIWSKAE